MKKTQEESREKTEQNDKQTAPTGTWQRTLYHCPYLLLIAATTIAAIFFTDVGRAYLLPVHPTAETRMIALDGLVDKCARAVEQTFSGIGTDDREAAEALPDMQETEHLMTAAETQTGEQDGAKTDDTQTEADAAQQTEAVSPQPGVTRYEYYEPQPTDSPYYSDAGRVALTTEYNYTKDNISYFNDAAFIGDSRTMGISDYAGLDGADFYCDNGVSLFKLFEEGITDQRTGEKVDVRHILQEKQYGKIYIMLGMNDVGYGNTYTFLEEYRDVVEQIREWQPGIIIYVMANLHISREKNNPDTEFNNININDKNAAAAELANGTDVFYLDCNPLFTDDDGFLNEDLTFDGVHLYAQCYNEWKQFLLDHCVEPGT